MSASSFEGSVEGKAGWWISNFSYMSKTPGLNWEEGRFTDWRISSSIQSSWHNMRNALQGQSMVCVHSLTPTGQREMLFGERPASRATFCGALPLHFPTAMAVAWRISGGMSLPVPFRTGLWSCFLWICLTPFRTCCHCLPPLPAMAANAQSLLPAVQKNILPLLNTFSNSFNKFPFILLSQNWQLTISPLSHAPYPLSSWWSWSHSPQPSPLQPEETQSFFQCLLVGQSSLWSNLLTLQQKLLGLVSRWIS